MALGENDLRRSKLTSGLHPANQRPSVSRFPSPLYYLAGHLGRPEGGRRRHQHHSQHRQGEGPPEETAGGMSHGSTIWWLWGYASGGARTAHPEMMRIRKVAISPLVRLRWGQKRPSVLQPTVTPAAASRSMEPW